LTFDATGLALAEDAIRGLALIEAPSSAAPALTPGEVLRMALAERPTTAANIIEFDGQPSVASKLDYSVPMPGSQRGRRIVALEDLGLQAADWATESKQLAVNAAEEIELKRVGGGYEYDADKAIDLWFRMARASGVRGDHIGELERWFASPQLNARLRVEGIRPRIASAAPEGLAIDQPLPGLTPAGPEEPDLWPLVKDYLDKLKVGVFRLPAPDGSGGATTSTVPADPDAGAVRPALFLVEVYAISWFPEDYGLGRTVKTMSLLPGEEMTMRMRTWRSREQTVKESSSIFDSQSTEASDRFRSSVQTETTDKRTQSSKEEWHVEANVSASWGWGSANVSGGGSGEYHSGREQFAKQVNDASQEHAQQASSKRDTTVTSSTESIEKREDEETVERVIRNVNLRRTLNFVFRELNQRYVTKVHLLEVKIGFTNGRPGTWREVPLSGLRGLLTDVLKPARVDAVATQILNLIGVVFDKDDGPANVLETVTMTNNGADWNVADAARDNQGDFPPPAQASFYRFKRGPLGGQAGGQRVPGVVMQQDEVVLRTDSLVVEALLGQADALDEYAMVSQKADAEAKALANRRTKIVNDGLERINDGAALAAAYAEMVHTDGAVRLEVEQHQD
jgi:hypothetical protein